MSSLEKGYLNIYKKFTDGTADCPFHDNRKAFEPNFSTKKSETNKGGTQIIYIWQWAVDWLDVTQNADDKFKTYISTLNVDYKKDGKNKADGCASVYQTYKDANTAMAEATRETNANAEKEKCYR